MSPKYQFEDTLVQKQLTQCSLTCMSLIYFYILALDKHFFLNIFVYTVVCLYTGHAVYSIISGMHT